MEINNPCIMVHKLWSDTDFYMSTGINGIMTSCSMTMGVAQLYTMIITLLFFNFCNAILIRFRLARTSFHSFWNASQCEVSILVCSSHLSYSLTGLSHAVPSCIWCNNSHHTVLCPEGPMQWALLLNTKYTKYMLRNAASIVSA